MAESKIEALLRVSEANLARAERRLDTGEYDAAVYHASIAAESAANAMILVLGGDEAKDHRAISGLVAVVRRTRPELLGDEEFSQLIEKGREIQREVVYSRYPLKVAGRWVTPMDYYSLEMGRAVVDNAKFVVGRIRAYLKRWGT
ncbi:MAG: HEPN domain-containing protein [Candidatus Verstraetearchaeota archaeon]|nr:HEPN domain-containing protein [Candidatus Verstraetearchaeota archaeon]